MTAAPDPRTPDAARGEAVQEINGHAVVYRGHRFVCTRCEARLLQIMQFHSAECPGPKRAADHQPDAPTREDACACGGTGSGCHCEKEAPTRRPGRTMTGPLDDAQVGEMADEHAFHIAQYSTVYDGKGGVKWQDKGGLRCTCGWTAPRSESGIRPWGKWHEHVVESVCAALAARLAEVEGEVERLRAEAADTTGGRRVAALHKSYGDQIQAAFDAEAEADRRAEQAEAAVARVEALLGRLTCHLTASFPDDGLCIDLVGAEFSNGAEWTVEMCCLPCQLRAALRGEAGEGTGDAAGHLSRTQGSQAGSYADGTLEGPQIGDSE